MITKGARNKGVVRQEQFAPNGYQFSLMELYAARPFFVVVSGKADAS